MERLLYMIFLYEQSNRSVLRGVNNTCDLYVGPYSCYLLSKTPPPFRVTGLRRHNTSLQPLPVHTHSTDAIHKQKDVMLQKCPIFTFNHKQTQGSSCRACKQNCSTETDLQSFMWYWESPAWVFVRPLCISALHNTVCIINCPNDLNTELVYKDKVFRTAPADNLAIRSSLGRVSVLQLLLISVGCKQGRKSHCKPTHQGWRDVSWQLECSTLFLVWFNMLIWD